MNITDQNVEIRIDPLKIGTKSKYGFVFFEKTNNVPIKQWKGWSSIGGENAERFNNIKDLPIDVIWWTNLNKNEYWQLGRYRKFKESDFFGVDFNVFINENKTLSSSPDAIAKIWSGVFSLVLDQLSFILSDKDISMNFYDGDLPDFIKKQFNDNSNIDISFERVLDKAYQSKIICQIPHDQLVDKKILTLSKLRSLYFKNIILKSQYPVGNWVPINQEKLFSDENKIKLFIEKNKGYPMLLNIENIKLKQGEKWSLNNSAYLFLGNRYDPLVSTPIWITKEEYEFLKNFADFNVRNILINDKYENIKETIFHKFIDDNVFFENSIIKQLLISAYYYALTARTRDVSTRRKNKITPKENWIKMNDNMYCFVMADDFQKNGFIVSSYGNGEISIVYNEKDINIEKLIMLCKKHGLVIPSQLCSVGQDDDTIIKDKLKENIDNINAMAILNQWLQKYWFKYNDLNNNVPINFLIDQISYFYNGEQNLNKSKQIKASLKEIIEFGKTLPESKIKKLFKDLYSIQISNKVEHLKSLN